MRYLRDFTADSMQALHAVWKPIQYHRKSVHLDDDECCTLIGSLFFSLISLPTVPLSIAATILTPIYAVGALVISQSSKHKTQKRSDHNVYLIDHLDITKQNKVPIGSSYYSYSKPSNHDWDYPDRRRYKDTEYSANSLKYVTITQYGERATKIKIKKKTSSYLRTLLSSQDNNSLSSLTPLNGEHLNKITSLTRHLSGNSDSILGHEELIDDEGKLRTYLNQKVNDRRFVQGNKDGLYASNPGVKKFLQQKIPRSGVRFFTANRSLEDYVINLILYKGDRGRKKANKILNAVAINDRHALECALKENHRGNASDKTEGYQLYCKLKRSANFKDLDTKIVPISEIDDCTSNKFPEVVSDIISSYTESY